MSNDRRGINKRDWQRVRRAVLERDGWRCCQCGKAGRLEVDHKRPMHQGGAALDLNNLQTLCRECHFAKTGAENSPPLWGADEGWARILETYFPPTPPRQG